MFLFQEIQKKSKLNGQWWLATARRSLHHSVVVSESPRHMSSAEGHVAEDKIRGKLATR